MNILGIIAILMTWKFLTQRINSYSQASKQKRKQIVEIYFQCFPKYSLIYLHLPPLLYKVY